MKFKVPSIACEVCANTITKAIQNDEPDANVSVNVETKIVTVDTKVSEDKIKAVIISAGHTVE